MGQTLTHGIYLPDEGERNCYSGLAANWQLLDGAVGTVAEHTTQIAGKAPAVHTHTKADITDLFNSNFIPSANNSYDLGSSSYQWNNLYAKNYYYNGVAWGLDKANTWTADQTIAANRSLRVYGYRFQVKNAGMELGTVPSSSQWTGMQFVDKNNTAISEIVQSFQSNGNSVYQINIWPNEANSQKRSVIAYTYNSASNNNALGLSSNLLPTSNNTYNLGTSTNKWKTLNGTNPGALSLPSSDSADYIDLSSNLSTNAEYQYTAPYDGWLCLYVIVNEFYQENAVGLYRSDTSDNSHQWAKSVTAALNLYKQNKYQGSVMLPVESGKKYICYISLNANATINRKYLFFYKNKGNV